MNILNLDAMKIEKADHLTCFEANLEVNPHEPLCFLREHISADLRSFLSTVHEEPACLEIKLNSAAEMGEDDFLSLTNTIVALFFTLIIKNLGRDRERRLDVPAKLTECHMSSGMLKKAINHQTQLNKFNLSICWKDYHYELCE